MNLWLTWLKIVLQLRHAFSRSRTFLWSVIILASFSIRFDEAGVTSFVRALSLAPKYYRNLLDCFHSQAIKLEKIVRIWTATCLKMFADSVVVQGERIVLIADGIKNPKEGRKMPAVKLTHQESSNNSKPAYIMAHCAQAVSLLVQGIGTFFAVPLACRIHEGIAYGANEKKTLLDKLILLLKSLSISKNYYLIVDAYYASQKIARFLLADNNHLITRVRQNAISHAPLDYHNKKRGRGRPRLYGEKIHLREFFKLENEFHNVMSPAYDEKEIPIKYLKVDLMWRAIKQLTRFVFVIHPLKGKVILMTTDLALDPIKVIELYSRRFKIESTFKQAIHSLGTFAYHFWMKPMTKIKRGTGTQFIHRKTEEYKIAVKRKMSAFENYMQFGLIAQGLLQYLAVKQCHEVWKHFPYWMRTMNQQKSPSEEVTMAALRNTFPEFIRGLPNNNKLKIFLDDKRASKAQYQSSA